MYKDVEIKFKAVVTELVSLKSLIRSLYQADSWVTDQEILDLTTRYVGLVHNEETGKLTAFDAVINHHSEHRVLMFNTTEHAVTVSYDKVGKLSLFIRDIRKDENKSGYTEQFFSTDKVEELFSALYDIVF